MSGLNRFIYILAHFDILTYRRYRKIVGLFVFCCCFPYISNKFLQWCENFVLTELDGKLVDAKIRKPINMYSWVNFFMKTNKIYTLIMYINVWYIYIIHLKMQNLYIYSLFVNQITKRYQTIIFPIINVGHVRDFETTILQLVWKKRPHLARDLAPFRYTFSPFSRVLFRWTTCIIFKI